MNVKELKEHLDNYPDDAEVLIDYDMGAGSFDKNNFVTQELVLVRHDEWNNRKVEWFSWETPTAYDDKKDIVKKSLCVIIV